MEILLSWSGKQSRAAAAFFRQWLPKILPDVKPWHSTYDIEKGRRWFEEISSVLNEANACIVFCTPENIESPWLYWESGAIASGKGDSSLVDQRGPRIMPLLIGVLPSSIDKTPLSEYQATSCTKSEIVLMIEGINRELGNRFSEDELLGRVEKNWQELDQAFAKISEACMPVHIQQLSSWLQAFKDRFSKEWPVAVAASDGTASNQCLRDAYEEFKNVGDDFRIPEREATYMKIFQNELYGAYGSSGHKTRIEKGNRLPNALSKLMQEITEPYV